MCLLYSSSEPTDACFCDVFDIFNFFDFFCGSSPSLGLLSPFLFIHFLILILILILLILSLCGVCLSSRYQADGGRSVSAYEVVAVSPVLELSALIQDNIVGLPQVASMLVPSSVYVWIYFSTLKDLREYSPVAFKPARKVFVYLTTQGASGASF
jgi:hypothetical protein